MTEGTLDPEQERQEAQYEFPYHYIPELTDEGFSQTRHWSWGFRYLGGIRVLLDRLADRSFDSLVDIGCGDGRVLRDIARRHPDADLLGIDYSHRAVALANAMNPDIEYRCHDVLEDGPVGDYEVATLVEVLEHVPPSDLDAFVEAVAESLAPDGTLLVTVPHDNKPVQPKHYQHFSRGDLTAVLEPAFRDITVVPFDDVFSKPLKIAERLLGGRGSNFVVTNRRLTAAFWRLYERRYLYTDEDRCGRLAVACRKR